MYRRDRPQVPGTGRFQTIIMAAAIIFGSRGQDAYYLTQLLTGAGISVTGVSRSAGPWLQGDVSDLPFTEELIESRKPDYIFHLAANSAVHHGLLWEHQSTIVKGTQNILESVYRHSKHSRVFITGSGLQFVNTGAPISEKDELLAGNAYTLARIQSLYAARYYRSLGIKTFAGHLFHHDSPLRTEHHLNRKIVDTVKRIAAGEDARLQIGDVTVEKEFGFAGDIAKGIFHLVQQETVTEACIGTGKAYPISKWLDICFSSIGKNWEDHVDRNPAFRSDFKRLVSDPSSLESTGWKAETSIEELAALMLQSSGTSHGE